MKKILRFADMVVLVCATFGMLLQLWIVWGGTDDKGLYPAMHPGWVLSWVLSLITLALIWIVTRQVGANQSYEANFPPSAVGALGCLAGAIAVFYSGWQQLTYGLLWLDTLCGILALLGGVGLLIVAFCRFTGKQPLFFPFMVLCAYFALHVFSLGRDVGGEPEMVRYLFRFLATIVLIPATYQFWGFSVGLGNRQTCLFWCLLAAYLCITSAPAGENGLVYLLLGVWLMTNLCTVKYLPRRKVCELSLEPEIEEAPVQPEVPSTMKETFLPVREEAPVAETSAPEEVMPEVDVDEIIADILRQIDSNVQ